MPPLRLSLKSQKLQLNIRIITRDKNKHNIPPLRLYLTNLKIEIRRIYELEEANVTFFTFFK